MSPQGRRRRTVTASPPRVNPVPSPAPASIRRPGASEAARPRGHRVSRAGKARRRNEAPGITRNFRVVVHRSKQRQNIEQISSMASIVNAKTAYTLRNPTHQARAPKLLASNRNCRQLQRSYAPAIAATCTSRSIRAAAVAVNAAADSGVQVRVLSRACPPQRAISLLWPARSPAALSTARHQVLVAVCGTRAIGFARLAILRLTDASMAWKSWDDIMGRPWTPCPRGRTQRWLASVTLDCF